MKKLIALILSLALLCVSCAAFAEENSLPQFATIGDAVAAGVDVLQGSTGNKYTVALEKKGKYLRAVADMDDEANRLLEAIGQAEDIDAAFAAYDAYILTLPVSYTEEFTVTPLDQADLDVFVGKTYADLEQAGYEYMYAGTENGRVTFGMAMGVFQYNFVMDANEDDFLAAGENGSYDAMTVKSVAFAGFSIYATDLTFRADGSRDFTETENDASGMEPYSATGAQITGNIEDGCYVITVLAGANDTGEWKADEMAQDDTVVKLASAGTVDGLFTAKYEPTGDGDISVVLRHFNAHTCDEVHSFDLRVQGGKVTEEIGGSYTASPGDEDVDPFFSGSWKEKDTQFTSLEVTHNPDGGWNVEITSPVSHGAYVIRATVYHDCDYDGFVYSNGVKYDLVPGEETAEKEAATGLWGILRFEGTMDAINLTWNDMDVTGQEVMVFER